MKYGNTVYKGYVVTHDRKVRREFFLHVRIEYLASSSQRMFQSF